MSLIRFFRKYRKGRVEEKNFYNQRTKQALSRGLRYVSYRSASKRNFKY